MLATPSVSCGLPYPTSLCVVAVGRAFFLLCLLVPLVVVATTCLGQTWPLEDARKAKESALKFLAEPLRYDGVPLGMAIDCLASTAMAPSIGDAAIARARRMGDMLVKNADRGGDGLVGWYYDPNSSKDACSGPGSSRGLRPGTCDPKFTKYAFQTALATTCLARLAHLTADQRYAKMALRAVEDSWTKGEAPKACPGCFYYWYSYNLNDSRRYIRNTNALMGMAVANVFSLTHDQRLRDRALAVARAEAREITAGNMGYWGIDDLRYQANPNAERQLVENHVPYVAKGLFEIGTRTDDQLAKANAERVMSSWLFCRGETCNRGCDWVAASPTCHATVTIAPCFVASLSELFWVACQTAFRAAGARLGDYELWATFDAQVRFK